MPPEDRIRLQHMLDAALAAVEFVKGRDRAALDDDRMLLFAVIRAIEILGEAANKISSKTCALYPHFPWRAVIVMRNRLIHGYFDIDKDIVWRTVTTELPQLITELDGILDSQDGR